jgi:hypothetical protein
MKKYFAQLRPLERRLAVGVAVIVVLVLNWIFIWPHFSDWGEFASGARMTPAQNCTLYQTAISQSSNYESLVKKFETQGEFVAPEDQAINMMRTIQAQAAAKRFGHRQLLALDARTQTNFSPSRRKTSPSPRRTRSWWTFFTNSATAPRWRA